MFTLNIECSKDILDLHINFADGTCSNIGNSNERIKDSPNVKTDQPKSINGRVDDNDSIKTVRKNLAEYLDFDDLDDAESFEPLSPPTIPKRERDVNVTEESRNGKY